MGIPEKLTEMINNEHLLLSNALKREAEGASIFLDDVSPVEHELDVKVHSKNLISYSKYSAIPETLSGTTIIDNKDGTITVSGKPTENFYIEILSAVVLPKGTYYLSGLPSHIPQNVAYITFKNNKT